MSERSAPVSPPPPESGERESLAPGTPVEQRARWRLGAVLPLGLLVGILVGLTIVLALGGSGRRALPGGAQQGGTGSGYEGVLAIPAKPAPPIALRNYLGQPVSLSQYRGKAVLVTFLYTHCPDVCPLITSNLRVALEQLGATAVRAQVVAVSVDPRGDTPASVEAFVRAHGMAGRMQYLVGSARELAHTWAAWSVGSTREVEQPGRVAHSALVYGITASGKLTTIYPANFAPAQIAHDVTRLAAS